LRTLPSGHVIDATTNALFGSNSFFASGSPRIDISVGSDALPTNVVSTEMLECAGKIAKKFARREMLTNRMIFLNKGNLSFQSGEGDSPNEMLLSSKI